MPRILLVDDSATDRCLISGLVARDDSFSVESATNGREAMESIERNLPDLVITDIMMPTMSGLELVSWVRSHHANLPVVLMTSQGNEEIVVDALHRGAASYVSKRLLDKKLLDTIRNVLSVAQSARFHWQLLRCLHRCERSFVLENDASLFSPLLTLFLNEAAQFELWDESENTRVGVALQEALTNSLFHGNLEISSKLRDADDEAFRSLVEERRVMLPYCDRRIHVESRFDRNEAFFEIRDDGRGFDPHVLPDPTHPENLEKTGGRGVFLMRMFMDDVHYNGVGNTVTLVKRKKK